MVLSANTEYELMGLRELEDYFRTLLTEGPQGEEKAKAALDWMEVQEPEKPFHEVLSRAWQAAVADPEDQYLDFAQYLVNSRGYHDPDYFNDILEQNDFRVASILAAGLTDEDLRESLENIMGWIEDSQEVPEETREQEHFVRGLLAARGANI